MQASYAATLERDVASRTRELQAANADKDRLISFVAHDVRAPLTSLFAGTRALARDIRGIYRKLQVNCRTEAVLKFLGPRERGSESA